MSRKVFVKNMIIMIVIFGICLLFKYLKYKMFDFEFLKMVGIVLAIYILCFYIDK